MLFTLLDDLHHMLLQSLIPLGNNLLKDRKNECPVETAAIPPGFPILLIDRHEGLDLDIKSLIINKLVHQQC